MLNLNPQKAYCSELISEPIVVMKAIQNNADDFLEKFRLLADSLWNKGGDFYYETRDKYNMYKDSMGDVMRAAWFVFLVKSCFNGVIRFNRNKNNSWNVPWGKRGYKNLPTNNKSICTKEYEKVVYACAQILKSGAKKFNVCSFEEAIDQANINDLIYADPPYLLTDHNKYHQVWDEAAELLLANKLKEAHARGAKFILSNVYTYKGRTNDKLLELYRRFTHKFIEHQYIIGPKGDRRPKVAEILIYNF